MGRVTVPNRNQCSEYPLRQAKNETFTTRGLLPVTFASKKFKKGVYYNPYFTNDNPDSEGWLIFSIIVLLRYNIFGNGQVSPGTILLAG